MLKSIFNDFDVHYPFAFLHIQDKRILFSIVEVESQKIEFRINTSIEYRYS